MCFLQVAGQTDEDLAFLLKHDTDPFSRWDAAQRLQQSLMLHLYAAATDTSQAGSLNFSCSSRTSACRRLPHPSRAAAACRAASPNMLHKHLLYARRKPCHNCSCCLPVQVLRCWLFEFRPCFHTAVAWLQGASVAERCAAAGGVRGSLTEALQAVLEDSSLEGDFIAATVTLPAAAELQTLIPNADPVILHEVR